MLNQDHQVPEDHQVLEDQQADQQQQWLTFAPKDQFGMTHQTNAFTAHFQTSLFRRTQLQENGNVIATVLSSWWQTLMEQKLVNDKNLFDLYEITNLFEYNFVWVEF
jgi:hypothetical protein